MLVQRILYKIILCGGALPLVLLISACGAIGSDLNSELDESLVSTYTFLEEEPSDDNASPYSVTVSVPIGAVRTAADLFPSDKLLEFSKRKKNEDVAGWKWYDASGQNATPPRNITVNPTTEYVTQVSVSPEPQFFVADWKSPLTLTFDSNGGAGYMDNLACFTGIPITLPQNKYTKTGYNFAGWAENANASASDYAEGGTYTIGEGNATLYAVWKVNTYIIEFNANGGSGTMAPISNVKYNEEVDLTNNAFTNSGCSFLNWNTEANGKGISYADGESLSVKDDFPNLANADANGSTITLYAQWTTVSGLSVSLNSESSTNEAKLNWAVSSDNKTLNFTATGGATSYRWRKNGVEIDEATSSTYSLDISNLGAGTVVSVTVIAGGSSSTAVVKIGS